MATSTPMPVHILWERTHTSVLRMEVRTFLTSHCLVLEHRSTISFDFAQSGCSMSAARQSGCGFSPRLSRHSVRNPGVRR